MLSQNALLYCIHHVFLPPQLPQADDSGSGFESALLATVIEALRAFKQCFTDSRRSNIDSVVEMLSRMKTIHAPPTGHILKVELQQALEVVVQHGGYLPLHIRVQNAGVFISNVDDCIHFETFELAPLNEAVMSTKGRLRRCFPASAIAVPVGEAAKPDLQKVIAETLSLMSHQAVPGQQPQAQKAGQKHDEDRDTTHPGMVSELFDGFLTAIGSPVNVKVVAKHTREEVLWKDAKSPWRRSPTWLLLRVSLQLSFSRLSTSEDTSLYKQFMVFLMAHLLQQSAKFSPHSDLLHIMNAKLSRRLLKIETHVDPSVRDPVLKVMRKTHDLISRRWSTIQDYESYMLDLPALSSLDFEHDIPLSLTDLDNFIDEINSRRTEPASVSFHPSSHLVTYVPNILPDTMGNSSDRDTIIQNLHGFENWVGLHICGWAQAHKRDPDACGKLVLLMLRYHSLARVQYSGNAEAKSIMVLLALELWIACDRIGTFICPLLNDYEPGVSTELLQTLVLPFKSQMERLHYVETYLYVRTLSRRPSTKLFETSDADGFAARYFDQSPEHQSLLEKITNGANETKAAKLAELQRLKKEYSRLMRLHNERECDYKDVIVDRELDISEKRHSSSCSRCNIRSQADALQIAVHEWPLPRQSTKAKTVVFELAVPTWFGHWRDITMYLLSDVLEAEYTSQAKPRKSYELCADPHLGYSFFSSFDTAASQRIGLLSQDKPHVGTHRKGKHVSTAQEIDVCLQSGLNYQYHDRTRDCFWTPLKFTDGVPWSCTYSLPVRCQTLQKYTFRPAQMPNGPSPNTVIARQSECPAHMTPHEVKELNSIPLAYHLQWIEIALQLSVPSVDFKKPETTLMLLQCIYQTGPSCNEEGPLRNSHFLLGQEDFASTLLDSLKEALQRVEQNWESSQALAVLIAIARRLLSLSSSKSIQHACLHYLQDAANVSFRWLHLLSAKAYQADDTDRHELRSRVVEAALICSSTFDVDRTHLPAILEDSKVASVLLQCSIVIHDGRHALTDTDTQTMLLHTRHLRLLRDVYHTLAMKQVALHDAIGNSWSTYEPGEGWSVSDHPHWVTTWTAATSQSDSLPVHVNLLSGELLVKGLPINHLPREYEQYASYQSLFGKSNLEVMPSNVTGLQFSSKREHHGYRLHFGLKSSEDRQSKDFIMQATGEMIGSTYELVPSRLFEGHFPESFVKDYVHWYHSSTGYVQFRPVREPWNPVSSDQWTLIRYDHARWKLMMLRNETLLVNMKSDTATLLASILSPLAKPHRVHCILNASLSLLKVEIPALRLAFDFQRGDSALRSREFRHMIVDPNQSLGSLVGCRHKLILRGENTDDRKVLLVEGNTSYHMSTTRSGSVGRRELYGVVEVDRDTTIRWHVYDVDFCLGRLVPNGSLQSELLLTYLHALTSSCLPDPLTNKTGTEQALDILRSAAVRSFDQLEQETIRLLTLIADLTPKRAYYPASERVMQTIQWHSGLGALAQHPWFYELVKNLLDQAERYAIFYPTCKVDLPTLQGVEPLLQQRDCVRSSTWRVSGYGAEDHTTKYDVAYQSRDRIEQSSSKRLDAFILSSHIHQGRTTFHWGLPTKGCLWAFLGRVPAVWGPNRALDVKQVKYDATFIQDAVTFLSENWTSLHRMLSQSPDRQVNKYALMMWLSTLACSSAINKAVLEIVAMFYTCGDFRLVRAPNKELFCVPHGHVVSKAKITENVRSRLRKFKDSPDARLSRNKNESNNEFGHRKTASFQRHQQSAIDNLVSSVLSQWPTDNPNTPGDGNSAEVAAYVDVEAAMRAVTETFKSCFNNLQLHRYLQNVEKIALCLKTQWNFVPHLTMQQPLSTPTSNRFASTAELFLKAAPDLTIACKPITAISKPAGQETAYPRLEAFSAKLKSRAGSSTYELNYVDNFEASLVSLQQLQKYQTEQIPTYDCLSKYLQFCRRQAQEMLDGIKAAVIPTANENAALTAMRIQQWPRMGPILFLQQLRRDTWKNLTPEWQRCLVSYGLALTWVQRAQRLVNASRLNRHNDVVNELQNVGHQNWDPTEYPESLLLEIESKIMIRDVQEQIASEMRNPQTRCNTSMQLNMGEGKSSVIVPMVAAALADGSRLVRVVVGKPQAKQMAQLLISKLGGLLNHRVYYLPVSRSLKFDTTTAYIVDNTCRECMANNGILLMQPEHILSFKLMGLERYVSDDEPIGKILVRTQDFFDRFSRDIVDESDENFSVKFELIYTMGLQRNIDYSPHRWFCIQQILELVNDLAPVVANSLPASLEIQKTSSSRFQRIRILREDAVEPLLEGIGRRICDTGLARFPISRQPLAIRNAVFTYITKTNVTSEEIYLVEKADPRGFWSASTQPILFLLRGLLADGVLAFILSRKRWRVNYGLDTSRIPTTQLAVPFRAKDQPTASSEFSHPDVVILLTSLSYYYGGLADEQLFTAFEHLLASDQKDIEYQAWVRGVSELPVAFHKLESINLKDKQQCTSHVFPALRFNKHVVDYFLSYIVFPKEMKEFPHKLSASGWDIGKVKHQLMTAFSGTSDSRALLPLDVEYLDLPKQQHTNALVLDYLLQPENSVTLLRGIANDRVSNAVTLLSTVRDLQPPIRVILDVGAQILEMNNLQVARTWLDMHNTESVRAVVFFNTSHELAVLDREGYVEPLQTSAFANQLDACLIFLDEAHTRGTDLQLPENYRAAVTLGANLTKDRLVQACMRMRKLGKGQTVVFCVNDEVRAKIQQCSSESWDAGIMTSDVLLWTISESCAEVNRTMPLWAAQGQRFARQDELWKAAQENDRTIMSRKLAQAFLEDEAQTLESRYRPHPETSISPLSTLGNSQDRITTGIWERCRQFDGLHFRGSTLQEEQERELSPEKEQERQVQRVPSVEPAEHRIHPDIRKFLSDGVIKASSTAYMPAFAALSHISAAAIFDVSTLGGRSGLLVTADFARTVKDVVDADVVDAYQRAVRWIITTAKPGSSIVKHAIIISPYEAQELYQEIRQSSTAVLHIYKPRWNMNYEALDHLNFFTVPTLKEPRSLPSTIMTQLNLFAGQLYFGSYEEYLTTCKYLGLAAEKAKSNWVVSADGFILRDANGKTGAASGLSTSPVPFLKELLNIRKNGEGFGKTHVGKLLDGVLLTPSDIEGP